MTSICYLNRIIDMSYRTWSQSHGNQGNLVITSAWPASSDIPWPGAVATREIIDWKPRQDIRGFQMILGLPLNHPWFLPSFFMGFSINYQASSQGDPFMESTHISIAGRVLPMMWRRAVASKEALRLRGARRGALGMLGRGSMRITSPRYPGNLCVDFYWWRWFLIHIDLNVFVIQST